MRPLHAAALAAAMLLPFEAPVSAQETRLPPSPAAAAPADPEQRIALLQRQLLAAQTEIVRLRELEAKSIQAQVSNDVCIAKNVRLVRVGRDILAAYDRRYRRRLRDPLQLDRTRFENEAQRYAGILYDNKYDVPALRQDAPKSDADAAPAPKNVTQPK